MDYAKSEEILYSVYNRNFNKYEHDEKALDCDYFGILASVFKFHQRATNMLIALLYLPMVRVGHNHFDGAKEISLRQILTCILP